MIINHNMASLNTYRQMSTNTANSSKSLEKLSSGLRINKAGDDAAGLAISEKMRGQIRGLDQAARNSQDGISMLQTAEGSLSETHSILQRMKELATQSANDTNVGSDRDEIQKEINQLSSEINRIGNTTEFNTKSLLKGDGKVSLNTTNVVTDSTLSVGATSTAGATNHAQATQTITFTTAAGAGDTASVTINGQKLDVTFKASGSNGSAANDNVGYNVTANSADVAIDASADVDTSGTGLASALQKMIDSNDTLKGNYTVSVANGGEDVTITAVTTANGGKMDGAKGNITAVTETGAMVFSGAAASVGTTTYTQANKVVDFNSLEDTDAATTDVNLKALVGTGMTINGQQIEFYNANDGAYTGSAIGVNISTALSESTFGNKADELVKNIVAQVGTKIDGVVLSENTTAGNLNITADSKHLGEAGNDIVVKDGGIQEAFKATFQVGANKGQSFTVDINDMRSEALGVTAKAGTTGFKATNTVTDGTSETTKEAALDVSTNEKATAAIKVIDDAIQLVSAERSKIGAFTNRLDHTITNLGTSSENLTAAESRVRDVDMAKEMMQFQKNNILTQAAQAMMAQANQQPQGVLQLLR